MEQNNFQQLLPSNQVQNENQKSIKSGKSHKQMLEETLGGGVNQNKPQIEILEQEEENFDRIELAKNSDDHQYNKLLKELNNDQNSQARKIKAQQIDLSELPQYKGKKISKKDMLDFEQNELLEDDSNQISVESQSLHNDEEEDDQLNKQDNINDNEENEDEEPIQQMLKKYKKNQNQLFMDTKEMQEKLHEIDDEDKQILPSQLADQSTERKKSKHLRTQLTFLKELVMIRFMMQKTLDTVKKMPMPQEMSCFAEISSKQTSNTKNLNSKRKYTEFLIMQNIDNLMTIRKNFLKRAQFTPNKANVIQNEFADNFSLTDIMGAQIKKLKINNQEDFENYQINTPIIYKQFESNLVDTAKPWVEENIIKWSQKTNILTNNLKKSGLQSLMLTPIGQTQKAIQQSYDKLLQKSQLKRSSFRILGKDQLNLQEDTCPEIYDDADLYHEMLKEYMNEIEQNNGSNGNNLDSDGLLLNSTRMYLLERKLKQQEKKQKVVDRRASKSRKIRYEVHPKLLNFMNPIDNNYLLEGRNEIVQCLYSKEYIEELKQQEQPSNKLQKDSKTSDNNNNLILQDSNLNINLIKKSSSSQSKKNKKVNKINKKIKQNQDNLQEEDNIELI